VAISSRSLLRSRRWSCIALRVSYSNAAGCRNGSTAARPSLPSTSAAAVTAWSVSAASAVVTRSCAWSVWSSPSGAAMRAAPRSVIAAEPSGRTIKVSAFIRPCEMPSAWRPPRTCHEPRRRSKSIWSAARELTGRPLASITRSASPWSTSPAAMTGITGTTTRSGANGRKASCSTCSNRPAPTRFAPRCQIAYHAADTSWPSQASRPNILTSSGRPSGVDARVRATPRGCRGASFVAVASTPSSLSTSVTWSSVSRPPGEPTRRCTSAADANPIRKPATTPIGRAVPSATAATAPIAISHRPMTRIGRARSGDAVTMTAVAMAILVAR
jgi:hypothetical protein